jgi:hypothetical protein
MSITIEEAENKVTEWFDNKTKLSKSKDFTILVKFLNNCVEKEIKMSSVSFSNDYHFTFIDIPNLDLRDQLRYENVFKLNILLIVKKIRKYFTKNKVNISLNFEAPSEIDCVIKEKRATYKHDAYIKVQKEYCDEENDDDEYCDIVYDEDYYDIGLEYFEDPHNSIIDNDKEISSNVILDKYLYYREEQTNKFTDFMKNVIYNIILLVCTSTNDIYTLSKINFFKNFEGDVKLLKQYTGIFNYIMDCREKDSLNINEFLKLMELTDLEGNEYSMDNFIEYIVDKFPKCQITKNKYKEHIGDYDLLKKLIINLHELQSDYIGVYKQIFDKSIDIFIKSQEEIMNLIKQKNKITKEFLPRYIENLLTIHPMKIKRRIQEKLFMKMKEKENLNMLKNIKRTQIRIKNN